MRIDTKRSLLALVVLGTAALAGCGSSTTSSLDSGGASENAGRGTSTGTAPGDPSGSFDGAGGSSGTSGTTGSGTGTPGTTQSGQLTAGVWDDNLNYDFFNGYLAQAPTPSGGEIFSKAERDAAHARAIAGSGAKTELDVAIVLDTTSSMADEIKYLQAEFDSIATTIKAKYPQTVPHFGLVVYRDHGDEYLTKSVPFTTDVAAFRAALAAQSSDGGGDQPEAVPEGLAAGVDLGWRADANVARVMFWVADAPQHPGEEQVVNTAVNAAVQKGIHVYPVGASGVDPAAELSMRGTAQITGGRYIFLTDDSGIGSSHAEPHIPCYVVTKLQGAMVRMVASEMNGTRAEPLASEVIRTVGSPTDGKCTLQNKTDVILY
jgi:hypothetical protein